VAPKIPRDIWTLWLQGRENAPPIVQACLRTWERRNPSWRVHVLDRRSLHRFLDLDETHPGAVAAPNMPPEAFSDVVRVALLERYGGVWVDGTLFCARPLDDWLPALVETDFFAFGNPEPRVVASWFLAATPRSYVMEYWSRRTAAYWDGRSERDEYFWFHSLFAAATREDPRFREIWEATPRVSADGPHYFELYAENLPRAITPQERALVREGEIPCLKLTRKLPEQQFSRASVYSFLLSQPYEDEGWRERLSRWWRGLAAPSAAGAPTEDVAKRILLAWYGAFDGHGTIGDLLSVLAVSRYLASRGVDVSLASARRFAGMEGMVVDWEQVAPEDFDCFLFTCGPIIQHHPETSSLFRHFEPVQRMAVGVSLFPPDHANHSNPFDVVLAREGGPVQYEDVALLAPLAELPPAPRSREEVRVGVVLRGEQGEYGPENCLWQRTAEMVGEALEELFSERPGEAISIENHLERSGLSPAEFEELYRGCDLVVTSRFHGAVMALRHDVPFVAVDQITGGAKVFELLANRGWPHVYRADRCDAPRLAEALRDALTTERADTLRRHRARRVAEAHHTLAELGRLLGV
jgi:hypothetical protein